MPSPSTNTIDVNLTFDPDIHKKPTVDNATDQNNDIAAAQASLEWQVNPAKDGVAITGVNFYSDSAKANQIYPGYLNTPGGHDGTDVTTWKIDFVANSGPRTATTIYYDVLFSDDDWPNLNWDPRLTISPR
jgi:hypothetical protein